MPEMESQLYRWQGVKKFLSFLKKNKTKKMKAVE